jgi:myo-inositol-1-phosphate synthase
MKWGLMIVGIGGASASTAVAGLLAARSARDGFNKGSYFCALKGEYPEPIFNLCIAGWDYRFKNLAEALKWNGLWQQETLPEDLSKPTFFRACLSPSDYAVRVDGEAPTAKDLHSAVKVLTADIDRFRTENGLNRVIVANLSSPAFSRSKDGQDLWHSAEAYSLACVETGSDWIEFTPTDSISPDLIALASNKGSRLAGRDGSTGQTILKLLLRDYLDARGLALESWYSTNLIGNRDGQVLSHPDYSQTKIRDKRAVLDKSLPDPSAHTVEIRFHRPSGDNKESWDCVHFSGFYNRLMSLRVNWHGADSFLAAPLLFDIVVGLMRAEEKGYPPGLVSDLGILFKNPLGVESPKWQTMLSAYTKLIS